MQRLGVKRILSVHAPLACVDDPDDTPWGRWLARKTDLEHVADVGYPTPGSLGSWAPDHGISVVTLELPDRAREGIVRDLHPVLVEVLSGRESA